MQMALIAESAATSAIPRYVALPDKRRSSQEAGGALDAIEAVDAEGEARAVSIF